MKGDGQTERQRTIPGHKETNNAPISFSELFFHHEYLSLNFYRYQFSYVDRHHFSLFSSSPPQSLIIIFSPNLFLDLYHPVFVVHLHRLLIVFFLGSVSVFHPHSAVSIPSALSLCIRSLFILLSAVHLYH